MNAGESEMNNNEPAILEQESAAFSTAWAQFENMIGKNYLDVLNDAVPIPPDFDFDVAFDQIKMNHIVRIVYDKNENTLAKLSSLYSALNMSGASVYILLHNGGENTEFYIGVRADNENSAASAMEVLQNSFTGNFPGVDQKYVELESDSGTSLAGISDAIRNYCAFATVTGVPSLKDNTEDNFSQGLEKLIDSLGAKQFSALFLATPITRNQLLELEYHYQNLYSELSMLNISQLSLSEQESISFGKSLSEGISKSLSESISLATTQTTGTSTSTTDGKTTSLASSAAGAGAAAGAALGTWVFPGVGTLAGAAIGGGIGAIAGGFLGSKNHSQTTGTSESKSQSTTETHGTTTTTTTNTTTTETLTDTRGRTLQYEVKNRRISDALEIIEEQLERVRVAKNYGAWNWAAYFSAPDIDTVKIGAEAYSGILRGEKTGVEHCAVSYWTSDMEGFNDALTDISCFRHPRFNIGRSPSEIIISPTAMLSTQEMAVGMALPQKSTPGLPIFESVEFGRSVTTYDVSSENQIEIGRVSHFGTEENNVVKLDVKSLTAHTFITGSTGAGKSNAVYSLLSELQEKYNTPFLVVEPAKGEYKHVFPKAHVFGTNPYQTDLLKINPFSFPKQIHITEHIDRLIEILNAVWPMYAAMPAVLKEAVELTYRKYGWDLLTSCNRYSENGRPVIFPDFVDLLETLPTVIDASQYSEEVKSNYAGSLVTRVKSLTNGYYRNIFQKDELAPEILFDQTCIVDLSRVGSSETKSMLMGVIFLKLQEYRMSNADQQNAGLRHITVLEEAHNLLRRTDTAQGQESANLQGKAVEMITNAIAEMRTYGEGFIIADQAPGLLDESVIRNTNTKIVLRLPDFDDRLLVGKAENLSDEQIDELARLKTGCASVYQNNWQEAVLCQIRKYDKNEGPFKFSRPNELAPDSRQVASECFLGKIAEFLATEKLTMTPAEQQQLRMYFPDFTKEYANGTMSHTSILKHYGNFIGLSEQIKTIKAVGDFEKWTDRLIRQIFAIPALATRKQAEKDHLLKAVFRLLELQDSKKKELWHREMEHFEKWRIW